MAKEEIHDKIIGNDKKISLLFYKLKSIINSIKENEELKITLLKEIENTQKNTNIKDLSNKEIKLLKEFGFIE